MALTQVVKNNCLIFPGTVPGAPGHADRGRSAGAGAWHFLAFRRPSRGPPGKGLCLMMSPWSPNLFQEAGEGWARTSSCCSSRGMPRRAGLPAGGFDGALCQVLPGPSGELSAGEMGDSAALCPP